jgi:hypothetical protein
MAVGVARLVSSDPNEVTLAAESPDRWRSVAVADIEAFGGVQFQISGDSLFALFENALKAVRSALSIQARLAQTGPFGRSHLRIGVHIGEVLVQDNQLLGETPAIAAGLVNAAEAGEVLVSLAVRDEAASRLTAAFKDRGVMTLETVSRSINTFRVRSTEPTGAGVDTVAALEATDELQAPGMYGPANEKPPIRQCEPNLAYLDETIGASCGKIGAREERAPAHGPPNRDQAPDNLLSAWAASPQERTHSGQTTAAGVMPASETPAGRRKATSQGAGPVTRPALPSKAAAPPKRDLVQGSEQSLLRQVVNGSTREALTRMLMLRLGPITPVIINRWLDTATTLAELTERLGGEIPSARERAEFLAEAKVLLTRPKT